MNIIKDLLAKFTFAINNILQKLRATNIPLAQSPVYSSHKQKPF